jgi:hypothetical protein
VPAEELRHFHLLRHEVLADPLKEIILRQFAAGRQARRSAATASICRRNAISSATTLFRASRYSVLSFGYFR